MKFCPFFLIMYLGIALGIFYILILEPIFETNKYNSNMCKINEIVYPISLPNLTDTYLWESCDCGRQCESLSPCLQLHVSMVNDSTSLILQSHTLNKLNNNPRCTFIKKECDSGLMEMLEDLQSIKTHAEPYNYLLNNNLTIECYSKYQGDEVFLNNNLPIEDIQQASLILGISVISLLSYLIYICYNIKKNKKIKKKVLTVP